MASSLATAKGSATVSAPLSTIFTCKTTIKLYSDTKIKKLSIWFSKSSYEKKVNTKKARVRLIYYCQTLRGFHCVGVPVGGKFLPGYRTSQIFRPPQVLIKKLSKYIHWVGKRCLFSTIMNLYHDFAETHHVHCSSRKEHKLIS